MSLLQKMYEVSTEQMFFADELIKVFFKGKLPNPNSDEGEEFAEVEAKKKTVDELSNKAKLLLKPKKDLPKKGDIYELRGKRYVINTIDPTNLSISASPVDKDGKKDTPLSKADAKDTAAKFWNLVLKRTASYGSGVLMKQVIVDYVEKFRDIFSKDLITKVKSKNWSVSDISSDIVDELDND